MRSSFISRFVPAWLTLAIVCLVAAAQPASAQTLTSDKEDYQPGETCVLTGAGFAPNEIAILIVLHADGTPQSGLEHQPWPVAVDANGDFVTNWHVCEDDCLGATLIATADQASGPHAEALFTDALGPGRLSNVTPLDGGCTSTDVPCTACGVTSGSGAIQSWYVQQGKTYAVTLSCITNCASGGTAPTIEVLVANILGGSAPSQCLTATKVATGVYTFTITMPAEACYSFSVQYCTSGCLATSGFFARRCDGRAFQANLKAGHFLAGCVPVADPNFADECCSTPSLLGVPADVVVDCASVPAAPTVSGVQSCSQCATVSVTYAETSNQGVYGTCAFSTYQILRTWTVTDGCGNRVSRSQLVRVKDLTPPTISGQGPNLTLECPASPNFTAPTASDNCNSATVVQVSDVTTPGCGGSFTQTKTWKAVDPCGNESGTVSQTIAVVDTTPPNIGTPGANATLECPASPSFTAPSVGDACSSASLVEVSDVTTPGCGGSYGRTKTWKAVDACGNQSVTVSQTINVVDTTPPVIGAPGANATLECPASPSFTAPTATDACSSASVVEVSDITTPGCGGTYGRTKTWKAVDACGNQSATVSQTINVVDTTPPIIGAPGANATLECPASPSFTAPTATDACGSASVVEVSDISTPGCGGTYGRTKTWKAVDACGNPSATVSQTINVVDTTPPVIGAPGANATLECPATPTFTAPTATDACGSANIVEVSDITTPGCGGSFGRTKTWKAVDACGNQSATVSQTISLVDTTPPLIGAPGNDATVECPAQPAFAAPSASDNCSNATVVLVSDVTVPGCGGTYTETKTWKAVDGCGNESDTVSQTIHVVDTTPPVISAAAPNVTIECSVQPHFTVPTATDSCSCCCLVQQLSDVTTYGCGASYSETKSWRAVDACGNFSATVSQMITVIDTTPPVLTSCAPDLVLNGGGNCCINVDNLGRPTATDACSFVVYQSNPRDGACLPVGDTSVDWIIRDSCGNFVTCTQHIVVLGQIRAMKFYDGNANGVWDLGEAGIPGWKFVLNNGQIAYTDLTGTAYFNVPIGSYTVSDVPAAQANWVSTTPSNGNATITAAIPNPTCTFGNYCFSAPSNGHPPSFWTTRQGSAVLAEHDPFWRPALNALNLRDAAGNNFDLNTTTNFSDAYRTFRAWLDAANSTNMAYMLSVQLATAKLDVLYTALSDSTTIVVPGGVKATSGTCVVSFLSATQGLSCGGPPLLSLTTTPGSAACGCSSNNGVVVIGDLLARADCLLGAYANTTAASTQRTYEESVKVLIDMVVNNGNNRYSCGGLTQYINGSGNTCPATFH